MVQVVLGEGHPETGATDALEVLDEGFKLLVVHEEALLGPDAVRGEPIAKMHTRLSGEQRTTVWGALLIFLSIQAGYA